MKVIVALVAAFILSFAFGLDWIGFAIAAFIILGSRGVKQTERSTAKRTRSSGAEENRDAEITALPTIARVRFDYVDADGVSTKRTVSIKRFDHRKKTGLITGFCHHRQAGRSFRYDRIENAIDADSGEVLDDLQKYLIALKNKPI